MAEEPLRKWPSSERVLRSRCSLRRVSGGLLAVHCGRRPDLQVGVHLDKGTLGLGKEVVHDALAELALLLVLVHLEDLLKRGRVDAVACTGDGHDAVHAAVVAVLAGGQKLSAEHRGARARRRGCERKGSKERLKRKVQGRERDWARLGREGIASTTRSDCAEGVVMEGHTNPAAFPVFSVFPVFPVFLLRRFWYSHFCRTTRR